MNRRVRSWPLLTAACLFLAACITLEPRELPPRPERAAIVAFTLEGRISVRQGDKSYQAGIQWQHSPARDQLLLTGPLGQGLAELARDETGARLTGADHKVVEAADADSLARQLLGVDLPLAALPDWVLGRVASTGDWQVDVLRYESDAANALPQLLELRRDELTVRIKIDDWQLP